MRLGLSFVGIGYATKMHPTLRRMGLYLAYQHRNREMCWLTQLGRENYWVRYRTFVEPRRSCSIEEFRRLEAWTRIKTRDRIKGLPTNAAKIVRVEVNTQEGLCLEKKSACRYQVLLARTDLMGQSSPSSGNLGG